MARILDAERNALEIDDKISGSVLEIYYQMPTNAQRIRYSNALTVRKGGKVKIARDIFLIQAKFGQELLTGIKKGDFIAGGKAFASESTDPDFDPKWKEHMLAGAADILAYLARTVFGAVDKPAEGVEFEELDAEDLENPGSDFSFSDTDTDATAVIPDGEEVASSGSPLSGQ